MLCMDGRAMLCMDLPSVPSVRRLAGVSVPSVLPPGLGSTSVVPK